MVYGVQKRKLTSDKTKWLFSSSLKLLKLCLNLSKARSHVFLNHQARNVYTLYLFPASRTLNSTEHKNSLQVSVLHAQTDKQCR